ncbi:hypothetical protein CB0940_06125 [Cercospora beticola]|uniref:Uncharacterized protein n=1 Tax=Cercospora beticola TaxID=122368 RepID=A0A2G5HXX2_CERBT|nr:hypothetical protein CB0940_06125 [Cercospora beticola]PIA97414.1 hypothetical protein CB0940_06125 [Cercospora beticola]WPA98739.1 hypothetical protein RHO25_003352 [Cercospora beticola]
MAASKNIKSVFFVNVYPNRNDLLGDDTRRQLDETKETSGLSNRFLMSKGISKTEEMLQSGQLSSSDAIEDVVRRSGYTAKVVKVAASNTPWYASLLCFTGARYSLPYRLPQSGSKRETERFDVPKSELYRKLLNIMLSEWLRVEGWFYERFGPFLTALLDSLSQLVTSPRKGMDITVVFTRVSGWVLEETATRVVTFRPEDRLVDFVANAQPASNADIAFEYALDDGKFNRKVFEQSKNHIQEWLPKEENAPAVNSYDVVV